MHLPRTTALGLASALLLAPTARADGEMRARGDSTVVARGAVETVVRDPAALAPEFRARLDRVLERMREEFGYDVEIVETLRSASRQAALFAQGRTRSGPVVTWTLNSAHLGGYAADVAVRGAHAGGAAYARLAVLARQEGLRTLGARDPGHVELPGGAGRPPDPVALRALDAARAPAGSARARARIVASRGVPPSERTVFAESPYAAALTGPSTFLGGATADDAADDDEPR